ncbi:MAG TPA: DUF2076 domain-containing protein [Gemmatirosa sp.]
MTPQEHDVLLPLLDRLRQTRLPNKDADADQLIRQTVQAQPDAPYILAQTVLMQDYALHAAQDRIHALEQQVQQLQRQLQQQPPAQPPQSAHGTGGGFLSSLFGGHGPAPAAPAPNPGYGVSAPAAPYGYGPQIANAVQPGSGGSSFLRSAAQTAAGVAGGALLVQGLEGLFGNRGGGGFGGLMGGAPGGALGGALGGAAGFLGDAGGGYDSRATDDQPIADDRGFVDTTSVENAPIDDTSVDDASVGNDQYASADATDAAPTNGGDFGTDYADAGGGDVDGGNFDGGNFDGGDLGGDGGDTFNS